VIRAVLFDWGDTLTAFEWSPEIALEGNAAGLVALGERDDLPDVEAIGAYFAERRAELFDHDRDDEVDLLEINRLAFAHLGARLDDGELERYLAAAHAAWHRSFSVPPIMRSLLESLRDNDLRLALVSNTATPGGLLRAFLEEQGIAPRVDAIVLSSEVGKRKPHAAMFERALAELGVAADEAVFVGDRLYQDVLGAGRLGLTTVQALWFRADEHPNGAEPDFQAFTPFDVLNVVRRLNGG
jgi:putative hydrolase of the HAD superfamily